MAKIVKTGHPALHQIAEAVPHEDINSAKIKKVLKDMKTALMTRADGVAIAAPQIGVPLRIFLVSPDALKEPDPPKLPELVCINPEIIRLSREKEVLDEGCLSVDGLYGMVKRAKRATIRAYDEKGNQFERGATGLLAQIFQHETDHLDGILFTDRALEMHPIEPERHIPEA